MKDLFDWDFNFRVMNKNSQRWIKNKCNLHIPSKVGFELWLIAAPKNAPKFNIREKYISANTLFGIVTIML